MIGLSGRVSSKRRFRCSDEHTREISQASRTSCDCTNCTHATNANTVAKPPPSPQRSVPAEYALGTR